MGIQINGQTDTISAFDNNFSLAGNVSIGGTLTYEDVTSVDAVGLSTFQAGIHLDDSIIHLGDTNTKIRFPAADTITAETSGSERFRIDSDGRVLIGTDTPRVVSTTVNPYLQIEGTTFHKSALSIVRNSNDSSGSYLILGKSRATSNGGNSILADGDTIGEVRWTGSDGVDLANVAATIRVNVDGSISGNDTPATMSFRVNSGSTGTGERLKLTADNSAVFNGTSYTANSNYNQITCGRTDTANTGITIVNNGSGDTTIAFADSGDTGAGRLIYNHTNNSFAIKVNGTNTDDRLHITSAGNVGINTANPTAPLAVMSSSDPEIRFGYNETQDHKITWDSSKVFLEADPDNANGSSALGFKVDGTERLRIDSSGRLLKSGQASLTSTTLSYPIQVAAASDANAIAIFGRAADDIGELGFYEADKTTKLGELQYRQDHLNLRCRVGDIRFASGGTTETLRIDGSGRIAQGGKTPTNHGSPNLLIWGSDPTVHLTSTGSTANTSYTGIKFAVAGGSTGDYSKAGIFVQRQDSYNDLDMIFAFRATNDAAGVAISDEKLRIDSDGKLLIGTTSNFVRGQVQIIDGGGGELTIGRSDTSVASGNDLGHIFFASNDSGTTPSAGAAAISCYADASHTSSSAPASLRFLTCESGSVNTTERLRIHAEGHGQFYKGAVTRLVCASDVSLSGTSQVTDLIPSWATKITLILYRASLTGTADFLVQLRVNGSDITTNYNSGSANHTGNTHNTSTEGFIIANTNSGHKTSGRMVIERVGTDDKWVATHMVIQDSGQAPRYGAGDLSNYSGTISGLKVKDTGANQFDNGTMTVIAEA